MSVLKYLMVIFAVLAAAFFLSHSDTKFITNSYADIVPAAINVLFMPVPESLGDEWYEAHRVVRAESISVRSF
jgi:hypothetical protein